MLVRTRDSRDRLIDSEVLAVRTRSAQRAKKVKAWRGSVLDGWVELIVGIGLEVKSVDRASVSASVRV